MNVNGKPFHSIWLEPGDPPRVRCLDQTRLPHALVIEDLDSLEAYERAIKDMHVRGAILIGVTASFGMVQAAREAAGRGQGLEALETAGRRLKATRPTAVNLAWAVERQLAKLRVTRPADCVKIALDEARSLAAEEEAACRRLGENGLEIIRRLSQAKAGKRVNILTHCNAGWLACVDYGTATAPLYAAFNAGLDIHVWVDETRPWNQGARLTAWELGQHGVPHTVIADNVGGHLMQHGLVDMAIVGSDRTTRTGDVANKIGTYLKALAAHDNQVPFYVALTASSFDWSVRDGVREIPIEERSGEEVRTISGWTPEGVRSVLLTPSTSPAVNYGFDVTPSRLVTGLVTERGVCPATESGIAGLFPDLAGAK
ncbi:MAG: S-methyl-5-thioribose-1-phosphate isomerase [candidate division FCPU426 bacterium]